MTPGTYFVYILASGPRGTLYIGVTNDLLRRVSEHRAGIGGEFTRRYHVRRLVYFEQTSDVRAAIQREKQLKGWRRVWKLELIERANPSWTDLADSRGPKWIPAFAGMTVVVHLSEIRPGRVAAVCDCGTPKADKRTLNLEFPVSSTRRSSPRSMPLVDRRPAAVRPTQGKL